MGDMDLKIVDSKGGVVTFMTVFVAKRDSAYPQLRVADHTVTLIPCKQRYILQLSPIAINQTENIYFMS